MAVSSVVTIVIGQESAYIEEVQSTVENEIEKRTLS